MRRTLLQLSKAIVAITCVLGCSLSSSAQFAVTTNGGSGLNPTYGSLAAALTALNAATITSPVVITCPTGTETAPSGGYSITAQGTAVNTITIQGNGAANSIITAANPAGGSGSLTDGIFKLIGADHVTIQGFTMQENALNATTTSGSNNMTEWGVAFLYAGTAATANGAKNNTIQNNTITLNRSYANSFGIYSSARHTSTSVSAAAEAASAAGAHTDNKIYGNSISNVNLGICLIGANADAVMDTGFDIGGSASGTGNSFSNWGNTGVAGSFQNVSGTVFCAYLFNQKSINFSYNTLTSASLSSVSATRGIFLNYGTAPTSGSFTNSITNNTVTVTTTAAPTFEMIRHAGMSTTLSGVTINLNNNTLLNCSSGGEFVGIINNNSVPGTLSISGNIIRGTTQSGTTSAFTGIQNNAAVVNQINITNNQIGNASGNAVTFSAANSSAVTGITNTGGASTCALSMTGNDFRGFVHSVAGSSAHTYLNNTAATLSQNISNNTFTNLNVNTTGNVTFVANAVSLSSTGTMNVNSNQIVTGFNKGGAGGTVTFYSSNASSVTGSVINFQNNVISNVTVIGATAFVGINNTDGGSPTKTITGNTISNISGGTGSINPMTINFMGGASSVNNNTISNINWNAALTALTIGTSSTATTLTVNSNSIHSITSNNALTGLSVGSPSTTANITGNTLHSLTSTGGALTAIAITGGATATYSGNTIRTLQTTATICRAIWVQAGTSFNIVGNKIHDITGGAGSVNAVQISAGPTTVNITNNLIGDLRAPTANNFQAIMGMIIDGGTSTTRNVAYNTVYINTTSTGANFGAMGFQHAGSTTATTNQLVLRNNIFVVLTNNGAIVHYRTPGASSLNNYSSSSNNNLFYAGTPSATKLLFSDGSGASGTAQTLAAYKAGVFPSSGTMAPRDNASVTENPPFLSTTGSDPTFLHIDPATATQVESGGVNIAGITTDYDGDTRNVTTPDIGADEGTFLSAGDATAPVINYTIIPNTCSTGDRTLSASISDVTGVPTSGALQPRIYFRKNAGTWFSAQGSLFSGTSTSGIWDFVIPAATMGGLTGNDVVQYYVIAQDLAGTPNIGSNPAVGLVAVDVNTVATHPTTPNTFNVILTMSGTYTVGTGGAYTTITAAVAAYNANCLGGPVVFSLTDATYGSETYPITINANADASATNTLTIRPAAGVSPTFSGSSATAMIVLNGADHVKIDGSNNPFTNACCPLVQSSRNLTITNTNTSTTSAVVWMSSGSTNNAVRNCILVGNSNTTTLYGVGMGGGSISTTSLGTANNNNRIENNAISRTQVGIYTQGASAVAKNTGNVIILNQINAVSPNNVQLGGVRAGFESGIDISCNNIAHMAGSGTSYGISLGGTFSNSYTTFAGNEVEGATVSGNVIDDVVRNGDGTAFGIGVCTMTSASPAANVITNNMISGVRTTTGTPSDSPYGIVLGGGTGSTNVTHNTISLAGVGASSSPTFGIAVMGSNPVLSIRNNIFSNLSTSSGNKVAIALAYSTYSNLTSDHNDFWCAAAAIGSVGGLNTTPLANFSVWQSTTGKDANSKNVAPVFLSSTDLHLNTTDAGNISNLMNGGTTTSVTTDIDCAMRNALTPTIGADEFSVAACAGLPNAGTSGPANTSVCSGATVNMTNNASNLATGISYQWQVSTQSGGPYTDVTGGTGATTQSYTTGILSQGTYYYVLRIRCANETVPNGDSYSNEVVVTVGAAAPTATASAIIDCTAGGFYVAVNLTSLGGAFDVNLVPSIGSSMVEVDATGVYNLGPYTSGSNVSVDVINNTDPFCSLNLGSFTATTNCINNGDCFTSGTQNIPDNGCSANNRLEVNIPISGLNDDLGFNVQFGTVAIEVEHTYRGDLQISLISPTGQSRNLFLQKPSSTAGGNNLGDLSQPCATTPLVFQDGAAALSTLNSGTDNAAFGTFAPEQTLAGFTGNPNGSWTLRICDAANLDAGSLRHVQLNFLNMDCLGVFGGTTLPGSPCDDGNIETQNDAYDAGCLCVGEYMDCLGVPGGPALPGTPCDDGSATTGNDIYQGDCTCAGELIDCEGTPGGAALPGSPCDDGNAGTINDLWDGSCNCVGTPFGCQDNEVDFELGTDANGAQTSWEIVPSGGGAALCSGSGYADNSTITETCCLPNGCYRLIVYDSFGDGMTTGGYRLSDENGSRIIDNWGDGVFTSVSTIANNGAFCVPIGTDAMQAGSCDRLDLLPSSVVAAVPNPLVSNQFGVGSNTDDGYQFWIYNPDGSYSRLIYKSLASPGSPGTPVGPAAPAYLALSSIVTNPVPTNVKLNIRVRSRVNGVYTQFGPACVMMIDVLTQCPTTQLVNNTNSTQHSCGVTGKVVGASGNTGKIFCNAVSGANKYQWRFENAANSYVRLIATGTAVLQLTNWSTSPLLCGTHTYDVTVRASFDNGATYCPVGAVCTVGITNNNTTPLCTPPSGPFVGGGLHGMEETTSGMQLWPNPVLDGQVNIELDGITSDVHDVRIVVLDLYGKVVLDQVVLTEGASGLRTSLQLGSDVASGVYMVNVTAGDKTLNQRLMVE